MAVVCCLATGAQGESVGEDPVEVYFECMNNETQMAYVGQYEIGLIVGFNVNATDWEVETDSDLFDHNLDGLTRETVEAGSGFDFGMNFDRKAKPGAYDIPVRVMYTDDDGIRQDLQFVMQLEYVKAWRLVEFKITSADDLVLKLETYLPFDSINCEFDTDGSLLVDPEWRNMTAVAPGIHTFKTNLYEDKDAPRWDEDEVGYHVRGRVNGTFLELFKKNIDPGSVRDSRYSTFVTSPVGVTIIAVIVAAAVCVATLIYLSRRSSEPPSGA